MIAVARERKLAQWMLDVGVPSTRVFELLAASTGLARSARVIKTLELATDDGPVVRRVASRLAS